MANSPRRPRPSSGQPRFEVPPSRSGAPDQFEVPPGQHPDESMTDSGNVLSYDVSDDLMSMKRELEAAIFARTEAVSASALPETPPADMIAGVGIGPAHRDFESSGNDGPGAPVLNVYVRERLDMEATKRVLVDSFRARTLSTDRQPVNVIFTGPIDAQAHRHRERVAPCGISVGNFRISAGTLGALARGRSGDRRARLLMLSNNHVLANSNDAQAGDAILQPGNADMGNNPADRIAVLERWVPIDFSSSGANLVDCATGWCWPDLVKPDFIRPDGTGWAYFRVGSSPVPATMNMVVGKSGRTTQLTSGRVVDLSASIRVNFGSSGAANFRDQITIRGNHGLFSRGGDSGSLIWTWDVRRSPVGLLFAGGGEFTFANKIHHVLDALDIDLHT